MGLPVVRTPDHLEPPGAGQLVPRVRHPAERNETQGRIASDETRDLQTTYLTALRANRLGAEIRIERFWRLLSFHLCTGWTIPAEVRPAPMPIGTDLGRPRDLSWRDPDWIAQFATTAWPATETTKSFRARIKQITLATLLPEPQHAGIAGADDIVGEIQARRARLHRQIRSWQLGERHIPDHLLPGWSPLDGCHLEAIGYAVSRALRREVVLAHSGRRLTKDELIAGRGPLRQTREIAAINQLLDHDLAGLQILHGLAAGLAETDPVQRINYQQRRETLGTVRNIPTAVLRRLSEPVRERKVAARVRGNALARDAAAWLWVELAGGVLHHSPHHAAARTRLAAFDRALTPEDRLVLLEYGYDVLGAVADDVARQHAVDIRKTALERRVDAG